MPNSKVNHLVELDYMGEDKFRDSAVQICKLISKFYHASNLNEAGPVFYGMPRLKVSITDKGDIQIANYDDSLTKSTGVLLGTLLGIGLAKKKNVKFDSKGLNSAKQFNTNAALAFNSLADLAECVNVLAKSQDEKIDTTAISSSQRF